jgi:hypothetical protein
MNQTQISQNYEKAIIIHSLLNPFHNDRGTVNDHIHSGQEMFGVSAFWLETRVIIKMYF